MVLTIRSILLLVSAALAAAAFATVIWVTATYNQFTLDELHKSSANTLGFLVRQRAGDLYTRYFDVTANDWARQSLLIKSIKEGSTDNALIAAKYAFNTREVNQKLIFLNKVIVYDKDLNVMATEGPGTNRGIVELGDMRERLNARDKNGKRQKVAFLWQNEDGRPVHSYLLPVGGFRMVGFVEFITDPLFRLKGIGGILDGRFELLDGGGNVIFSDTPKHLKAAFASLDEEAANTESEGEGEAASDGEPEPAPAEELEGQSDENAEESDNGEEEGGPVVVDIMEAVIPADEGGVWANARLTRNLAEFSENSDQLRQQALLVFLGVLVIGLVGGYLALRFFVFSKLSRFAEILTALGEGDTDQDAPATGKDELRTIGEAYTSLKSEVSEAIRLRGIVENNPSPIMLASVGGEPEYFNRGAQVFFGSGLNEDERINIGRDFVKSVGALTDLPKKVRFERDQDHIECEAHMIEATDSQNSTVMLVWSVISEQVRNQAMAEQVMQQVTDVANSVAQGVQEIESLASSLSGQSTVTISEAERAKSISANNAENTGHAAQVTSELASSIANVANQTGEANRISADARTQAQASAEAVDGLQEASQQIGEVTNLINDIADQTRMLALNATIEAARAGEAGRGFAVVANEVRSLADQTAKATQQIEEMISKVQQEVGGASQSIGAISDVIGKINEIQNSIADNVSMQDHAVSEVNSRTSQIADETAQMSELIVTVEDNARNTSGEADRLLQMAKTMAEHAASLTNQIEAYRQHTQ